MEDPDTGLQAESNPIQVGENGGEELYWGLIHEHTELSDGQGSLDLATQISDTARGWTSEQYRIMTTGMKLQMRCGK